MILALLALGGCAGLQASYERRILAHAWGDRLLTCQRAPVSADQVAHAVTAGLLFPYAIGAGSGRLASLTLCMGEAGWTPLHPDSVGMIQAEGLDWRRMTPAEQEAWPNRKAAIRAYEQARADSIRKP
jgi:hypothetical protein